MGTIIGTAIGIVLALGFYYGASILNSFIDARRSAKKIKAWQEYKRNNPNYNDNILDS